MTGATTDVEVAVTAQEDHFVKTIHPVVLFAIYMSYVSFVKIVCNMSNCIRSNMKMKCHNDIDDYLFHSYRDATKR